MKVSNLTDAVRLCFDDKIGYPAIFKIDCGVGIKVSEKGLHAIPAWRKSRIVLIEIRTFKGISFGAIHYYGKLIADGVHMAFDSNPERSTFVDEEKYPLCGYKYSMRIHREVTKEELEKYPDRWSNYKEGDLTNCFESYQEIIEQAKEIFKLRFQGDWKLFVQYPWGRQQQLN